MRKARRSAFRTALGTLALALTLLATPYAQPAAAQIACTGDCNGNDQVTIDELVRSVNIALGLLPLTACIAIDRNLDGAATVNELITAVNHALFGCPAAFTPTATPPPPTATPLGIALQVDAGPDVIIPLDGTATLAGSVTTGAPSTVAGVLSVQWVKLDGPGTVTFGAPNAATTTARASAVGSYRLRLTAIAGGVSASDEMLLHVDLAAANLAPTLAPIADQTIAAGTALRLGLAGSDPNPFDVLTYGLVSGPPGATVDSYGIFRFAPLADQLGSHPVIVRVTDVAGLSAQRGFTVRVITGNRPPAFGALLDAVAPSMTPFSRQLTATDPDGDALTFALLSGPEGMTLAGAQLGWTPAAGQFGVYVVRVQVADVAGASAQGEFRIRVPPPAAPKAGDDHYEVQLGRTLTVPAAGVLANDASVDGSSITAEQLIPPDKGSVTDFAGDGSFTYVAPPALAPPPPLDATVKYQLHYGNSVIIGYYPPLVADVDGDGKPEVIFWRGDTITVVHGDTGEELFSANNLPAPYDGCAMYGRGADTFAAADIDDDGAVEIVMGAQCAADSYQYIYAAGNASRLVALAYDPEAPGRVRVKWLTDPLSPRIPFTEGDGHLYVPFGGVAAYSAITVARLRPAEPPTVLLGKSYSSDPGPQSYCGQILPGKVDPHCRIVFAIDGVTGAIKTPYYAVPDDPGSVDAYGGQIYGGPSAVSVADVNDDGALDLLYQGTLWNADGTIQRQFDGAPSTASGTADALLVDLDGDAAMEIVTLDAANHRRNGILRAWKPDGRLLWKVTLPADTVYTRLSAADIDRSGRPTILFAIHTTLYAVDHEGQFKWVRTFPRDSSGFHSMVSGNGTGFPVYDLNGDGIVDIVVQFTKSTILFLRGDNAETQASWTYPGGDERGTQCAQAPVIADLDGTGEANLIFYHDVNLNDHSFLQVLKGASVPWRAAPSHLNQRAFWGTNFNPDGSVPRTYPRHTANPASNVLLQQPPVPYALEPRLRTQAQFTYAAQSGPLASLPATVTIDILPENRPPKFTALPPDTVPAHDYRDEVYTFQLAGVDPDPGDVLTFGPADEQRCGFEGRVSISPQGLFTYWGRTGSEEYCYFQATLSDDHGAAVTAPIVIFFTNQQRVVPDVVGFERSTAVDEILRHDLTTGAPITVASNAPAGQVLAQNPAAGSQVSRAARVQLTLSLGPGPEDTDADGDGFTPNQGDCDDTDAARHPLAAEIADNGIDENCDGSERVVRELRVAPVHALRVTGETAAFTATAIYVDGGSAAVPANWTSTAPTVASIDGSGLGRALNVGTTSIRAVFGGVAGEATFAVAARNAGDQGEPTAILTAPGDGSAVSGLTQITGTATDANFLRYELAVAPAAGEAFNVIGGGTAAVVGGLLGTFDPTLLLNGLYTLRLTVWDRNGNTASADVAVQVEGDLKLGNFALSFTDLAIPLSGIPLRIERHYDSRDKTLGDFGVGWRLALRTWAIGVSRVLGSGWQVIKPGLGYGLRPDGSHQVSLTLPTGRVERFDLVVTPSVSPLVPLSTVRASFAPRPGTLGVLESLDNNDLVIADPQPGPVELLDDGTLNPYHPNRFRYTAADGTQIVVSRSAGVESLREVNGNTLTINPNGIVHSAGPGVTFTRDAAGRITRIADPMNAAQTYAYSAAGDLIAHTDPTGATTRFTYDGAHNLIRIEDPLGRPLTRYEYDAGGRLIAMTDATGNRLAIEHDLIGRQETVVDPRGHTSAFHYDEQGHVLRFTNPLGHSTTYTYDAQGNQLTQTDPLGRTISNTWDARGHLLSETDALGHTTEFAYDGGDHLLAVTNALGHTATNRYDARGNLVAQTDALGNTLAVTYDAGGNAHTLEDPLGHVWTNEVDAAGRRTRVSDPTGMSTDLGYDPTGRIVAQETDGADDWRLAYDAAGRLTALDLGGNARPIAYDAAGQVRSVTDAMGHASTVEYDQLGRMTALVRSDGVEAAGRSLDAAGNVVLERDALGNETRHKYDAANRRIETRFPDGGYERREYDAAGQLIAVTDPLNRTTRLAYDAAGRLTTTTDPLGGVTSLAYDAVGHLVERTDALGRVTKYEYDAAGRPLRTTFADGGIETRTYDAAGRLTAVVDPSGRTTDLAYDASGRLTAVTDPLGHRTLHDYDGATPPSSVTDANGNRTRYAYDGRGQRTEIRYPGGAVERATFDVAGRLATRTNARGETIAYVYDALGRMTRQTLPGGAVETFTYTVDGHLATITDARGTTRIDRDLVTRRITRVTEPDGRYVRYEYDLAGNRTMLAHAELPGAAESRTTYQYDAGNRLVRVDGPDYTTSYGYDAVGNLTSSHKTNNSHGFFTYDARDRVVRVDHRLGAPSIASMDYTLDAAGNRRAVRFLDGSRVEYDYDAAHRLTAERYFDIGGAALGRIDYGYDPAGNLVSRSGLLGDAAFTYNADNQLVAGAGATYTHDAAGNLTTVQSPAGTTTLEWDARGRLTRFAPPGRPETRYTYDYAGVRVSKDGPAGLVKFLVDRAAPSGLEQVLRESNGDGATLRQYVYGPRRQSRVEGDVIAYEHPDALGSIRLLTNQFSGVTDRFDYSAYGILTAHTGASAHAYGFAGEYEDEESGLYYLRARYYDPALGRFISRDPAEGWPEQPLSQHKYAYALDNPLVWTDPSGRVPTMAELMTAMQRTFQNLGQSLVRYQRAKERGEEMLGDGARAIGGAMAVGTIMDAMNNPWRLFRWFGLNPIVTATNTWKLGQIAFDMLGGKDVDFDIMATPECIANPGYRAVVDWNKIRARHRLAGSPPNPKYYIDLCLPFFFHPPLPIPSEGIAGRPSMTGIMVHEFSHITLKTDDKAGYGCRLSAGGGFGLIGGWLPGDPESTADAYRCVVRDFVLDLPMWPSL